VIRNFQQ